MFQDLRYACRSLRQAPLFAVVCVMTLALGIGANTAIFSVVDAVLLKPLPYPDVDHIYSLVTTSPSGSGPRGSPTKFNAWRAYASAFDRIAAFRYTSANLTTGDEPEQVAVGQVTADFFALFGAATVQGRTFSPEEDRPGGDRVVVLSYGFWQRRFAGDRRLLGSTLAINGQPHTVIGVLSPAFAMREVVPAPDLWLAFQIDPQSIEQAHLLWGVAHLQPGRTTAEARAQLNRAADDFRRRFPELLPPEAGFGIERYRDMTVSGVRASLVVLSGAVAFVLLIACANVASLALTRAVGRGRELAIRSAIGAGRARLIRQLLTESLLISIVSAAVGLPLGILGIRLFLALNPLSIPRIDPRVGSLSIDGRLLIFALVAAVAAGIAFGLFPALQVARADLTTSLKERGRLGAIRQNRTRGMLVVTQTALAFVLLVGSVLLIRTFVALRTVDAGFSADHVLTMRMTLTGSRFSSTAGVAQFARDAEERLARLPGVVAAGTTCCLPLEGRYGHLGFDIVGRTSTGGPVGGGGWVTTSPGYFDVFKIPLRRGRVFTDRDRAGSPPVVIISDSLARQFWPNGDPLADRLLIGRGMGPQFVEEPRQIVGIVGDVREALSDAAEPMMYVPTAQISDGMTMLLNQRLPIAWAVRTEGNPFAVAAAMQEQLRQASGGVKPSTILSMDDLKRTSTAQANFNMMLLTTFGGVALLLAAIGIYGLIAHSVEQRAQEIGLRMALGAASAQVRNMIVWQGLRFALLGIVVGLGVSFALARVLASFLFGVTPHDAVAFTGVPLILCAVALLGVWLPARRAARVDPLIAIRSE